MTNWPQNKIVANKGVITGCDANCEWMLPWWHNHYIKTNSYPIMFADFGMSKNMRKWCSNHGIVVPIANKVPKAWFKKPYAILNAPFELMIWVDLDCEIRKDLAPLFDYASKGVGLTKDKHTPFCEKYVKRSESVATGVVATYQNNESIIKWINAIESNSHKLRGDQEAFNSILRTISDVVIMPPECQWLRMDGDNNPDTIIMHWTGHKGKSKIKASMGAPRVVRPVIHKIVRPEQNPVIMRKNILQVRHTTRKRPNVK